MTELSERFWKKVNKGSPSECWEWMAYKNPTGYGRVSKGGKIEVAHRVAYELTYGAIPEGMVVMHRCDNPQCCNPGHLSLGTQKNNMWDCVSKGRR